MLQVHDIRETRVYQEALEEGIEKERRRSILQLAARKMSAEVIAESLGLELEMVRKTMADTRGAASGQRKKTGRGRKQQGRPD